MADTIDDVSDFPTPPRHPEDIKKEIQANKDELLDFMMERMSDFAALDAKTFAVTCAHNIGFLVRLNKSETETAAILREFNRAFTFGVGDAEEVLEEQEETNNAE